MKPGSIERESIAAFTLVELLVVITVIAILAALLFPVSSRAKQNVKRTTCLNNLRQINLGVRMYCDDANDFVPTPGFETHTNNLPWNVYKELMKEYVGLREASSVREKLFACPADQFYYDHGQIRQSRHDQCFSDFSSYLFNGMNSVPSPAWMGRDLFPGIAFRRLSSICNPVRTLLILEAPAIQPYSWHEPGVFPPPEFPQERDMLRFNDAMNVLSFVDGHVAYTRVYWDRKRGVETCSYDPPREYEYQWSGD